TVHYEGALPSPVPGQSLVTEQPRGWELTTAGPVIASHISGAFLSDLEPDDRAALDAALKRAYRSYADIISRKLTPTTNAAGHTVIMIPSATREMEEIESGFWSVADDVLDEQQETVLRANLRLRPRGYALDTPETSPLFRFGTRPFALEYWRVGNWYEW